MATLDVPDIPPLYAPVMVAEAPQALAANMNRSIGLCRIAESVPRPDEIGGGQNNLNPVAVARAYFNTFEHQIVDAPSVVTVIRSPTHGTLEDLGTLAYDERGNVTGDTGERSYRYNSEDRYEGKDSVILQVQMAGYTVKMTYFLYVYPEVIYDDTDYKSVCPKGKDKLMWRISSETGTGSIVLSNTVQSWLNPQSSSATTSGPSAVTLSFANLPAAAVGLTTSTAPTQTTAEQTALHTMADDGELNFNIASVSLNVTRVNVHWWQYSPFKQFT